MTPPLLRPRSVASTGSARRVETIGSLIEQLDLAVTPVFIAARRAYLAGDPARDALRHRYCAALFDPDTRALAVRFAAYCKRFDPLPGSRV